MKTWITLRPDDKLAGNLVSEAGLPPFLARILGTYSLPDGAAVKKFLAPKLSDLSDPFLLPGMEAAVRRIWKALEGKEHILVFGDYDVDGIAGTALLVKVLKRLGARSVAPCLPDRLEEGYGISPAALRRCFRNGLPGLVVTVDCGISAFEAAEFMLASKVDLVITDHHEPAASLPVALAVVNPKLGQSDSLKTLSGTGVAFKLCHALLKHGRKSGMPGAEFDLREYLDLVAVGTVADIVPLLGENRIFVSSGLKLINSSKDSAWQKLKQAADMKGPLDTYHLAYGIVPRLNAAGRLKSAETALELFLTGDDQKAGSIARDLDRANRERQAIEKQILKEAFREIDAWFDPAVHFGVVAGRRGWHIGVIGIVASRLAARYNRPAIVVGFDEAGAGRGSGRSACGFNLLDALEECRSALKKFGGHAAAAGLEMEEGRLDEFRRLFNLAAEKELKGGDLAPVVKINAWIAAEDVTPENHKDIEKLAPFGTGNPRPVLAVRGLEFHEPRVVGEKHLRFKARKNSTCLDAIAFNYDVGAAAGIREGDLVEVAFQMRINSFNGRENLELNVMDFRKSSGE
ncbi:MAG: single-stranded-DNA-specific exonuclease RecJ [Kiritimatiellia bacterium]